MKIPMQSATFPEFQTNMQLLLIPTSMEVDSLEI